MTNNNIYFIANWKMYGVIESLKTIKNVISLSNNRSLNKVNIIYCPPYTLLREFVKKTKNSNISVGAQNCHQQSDYGSYTGHINSKMIKKGIFSKFQSFIFLFHFIFKYNFFELSTF